MNLQSEEKEHFASLQQGCVHFYITRVDGVLQKMEAQRRLVFGPAIVEDEQGELVLVDAIDHRWTIYERGRR